MSSIASETDGDASSLESQTGDNRLPTSLPSSCKFKEKNEKPRALRWPPRSPWQVAKGGWLYIVRIVGPLELLFWTGALYTYYQIGTKVVDAYRPEPPYQVLNNGEVVLDPMFNRPFLPETFSKKIENGLTVHLPLCTFWLVGNFVGPRGDAHAMFCVYVLAIGLKILLVETVKDYVGYWRPYFFSRCGLNTETLECDGLADTRPAKQDEPWQSFPAGHPATAMCSMILLSLYLIGKVVGSTRRRNARMWAPSFLVKLLVLIAASPVVLGIFIGASRVRDQWHHPADVLAGMAVGAGTALLSHTLYYPSVWGDYAGIPRATCESSGSSQMPSQQLQRDELPTQHLTASEFDTRRNEGELVEP